MIGLFEQVRNNRGVHGVASGTPPPRESWGWWVSELNDMGIAWFKLMDNGYGSALEFAIVLREHGIVPIVRIHRPEPYPGTLPSDHLGAVRNYVANGIVLFETGNEPNLDVEWKQGWRQGLSFHSAQHVNQVVDDWVTDAQQVLDAGGLPSFPALAPTDRNGTHHSASSVMWAAKMAERLRDHHLDTARDLFAGGTWLAVHISPRDRPFGFSPDRGSFYDDCCLQGFHVCLSLLQNNLGVQDIPVISTEGGVFTPERMEKDGWGRPYDTHAMAQMTVAMYGWLAENEWQMVAMCPWILANQRMGHTEPSWDKDEWYRPGEDLEVIAHLKASPVVERVLPVAEIPPEPLPEEEEEPAAEEPGAGIITPPVPPLPEAAPLGQYLGIVREGQLRLLAPRPALTGSLRLTTMAMHVSQPPESEELDLSEFEGQAIMVRGHDSGGWIYSAEVTDQAGPILSALVDRVFA